MSVVGKHRRLAALPLALDLEEHTTDAEGEMERGEPVTGQDVVGAVIDKYFVGHGVFLGTVVAFHERVPPKQAHNLYTVKYADGDTEDYDWKELCDVLRPKAKPKLVAAAGPSGSKGGKNVRNGAFSGTGRDGISELEQLGERELAKQRAYQQLVMLYLAANPSKAPSRVLRGVCHFYEARMHWDASLPSGDLFEAFPTAGSSSGGGGEGDGSKTGARMRSAKAAGVAAGVDADLAKR